MGKFAEEWGKVDFGKERSGFMALFGINNKQIPTTLSEDQQMQVVEKMQKDMTWLERFSAPFQQSFKKMMSWQARKNVLVIQEFFDDMAKLGHTKMKLYIDQDKSKAPNLADHMVEYDGCGQQSRLNSTVTINGKINQFKTRVGLYALQRKGAKTLTVYLKHGDMKDHYVELNDSGEKMPFAEKIKDLR